MQFIGRYFFSFLLLFGIVTYSLSFLVINDQQEKLYPLRHRISESFKRAFQPEFPLPRFLKVDHIEVKHLRSYTQRGGACAWYAILNAYAIQELVEKNRKITANAIERIVLSTIAYIVENQISIERLMGIPYLFEGINAEQRFGLAEYIGLQNYYDLRVDEEGIFFWNAKKTVIGDKAFDQKGYYCLFDLKKTLKTFASQKAVVKHFITSTASSIDGQHAVLISLINRPGKKPMIIYMDSNNTPLDQCSLNYVTPFFVSKIIYSLITS